MPTMWIPLVFALLGLALFMVPSVPSRLAEVGKIAFAVGLFFVVWALANSDLIVRTSR